ncbi:hypothetical protein HYX14_02750 [Candidatus Woesearchaeota archaeon]|nr:hypothetical protein [Candidatus Woesearchaeota archaeon]
MGVIQFEGATPSNTLVADTLAKNLNVDANVIVMRHVYTQFGEQIARFQAYKYDSIEARKNVEVMAPHEKKKLKEAKKEVKKE